ncbi:thioredoxin domain-containing protein, partial [Salmonella sp. s55004]|uniref:thioredoxin domain-containing protein n=1 Tax=Salmonella sp. s55004 TaxID=3159675 RepID=UPI0039818853
AEQFEVKGYPTLKFYKNGIPKEYTGGRVAKEIISWLEKKTGPPATTLENAEDLEKFKTDKSVYVIGFFKDTEGSNAKAFLDAADLDDDVSFAITSSDDLISRLEATENAIV